MKVNVDDFVPVIEFDADADTSYMEQPGFEEDLEAWNNGELAAYSVYATVELVVNVSPNYKSCHEISTPGLHSIILPCEIDPYEDNYVREVMAEEYELLISILEAMGVTVIDTTK